MSYKRERERQRESERERDCLRLLQFRFLGYLAFRVAHSQKAIATHVDVPACMFSQVSEQHQTWSSPFTYRAGGGHPSSLRFPCTLDGPLEPSLNHSCRASALRRCTFLYRTKTLFQFSRYTYSQVDNIFCSFHRGVSPPAFIVITFGPVLMPTPWLHHTDRLPCLPLVNGHSCLCGAILFLHPSPQRSEAQTFARKG